MDRGFSELTSGREVTDLRAWPPKIRALMRTLRTRRFRKKPILIDGGRAGAHEACPEVEETLKWACRISCAGEFFGMAAFKQHCAVHFWKGKSVLGNDLVEGFGYLGFLPCTVRFAGQKNITSLHQEGR